MLESKTAELETTVSEMFNFVVGQFTSLFNVFPTIQSDITELQTQIVALQAMFTEQSEYSITLCVIVDNVAGERASMDVILLDVPQFLDKGALTGSCDLYPYL